MRISVRKDISILIVIFLIIAINTFCLKAFTATELQRCAMKVFVNDPFAQVYVDDKHIGPQPQMILCSEKAKNIVVKSSDGQIFSRLMKSESDFDYSNATLNIVFHRKAGIFNYDGHVEPSEVANSKHIPVPSMAPTPEQALKAALDKAAVDKSVGESPGTSKFESNRSSDPAAQFFQTQPPSQLSGQSPGQDRGQAIVQVPPAPLFPAQAQAPSNSGSSALEGEQEFSYRMPSSKALNPGKSSSSLRKLRGVYVQISAVKNLDIDKVKQDIDGFGQAKVSEQNVVVCPWQSSRDGQLWSLILLGPFKEKSAALELLQLTGGKSFIVTNPGCNGDSTNLKY